MIVSLAGAGEGGKELARRWRGARCGEKENASVTWTERGQNLGPLGMS